VSFNPDEVQPQQEKDHGLDAGLYLPGALRRSFCGVAEYVVEVSGGTEGICNLAMRRVGAPLNLLRILF
jgi:hypothetical protein